MSFNDPSCSQTPDGTFLFERLLDDGRRLVAVVLPEDVDEIAGPASTAPDAEEKRRRYRVARLLADEDLRRQAEEPNGTDPLA
jgi:hypothetical protein